MWLSASSHQEMEPVYSLSLGLDVWLALANEALTWGKQRLENCWHIGTCSPAALRNSQTTIMWMSSNQPARWWLTAQVPTLPCRQPATTRHGSEAINYQLMVNTYVRPDSIVRSTADLLLLSTAQLFIMNKSKESWINKCFKLSILGVVCFAEMLSNTDAKML